ISSGRGERAVRRPQGKRLLRAALRCLQRLRPAKIRSRIKPGDNRSANSALESSLSSASSTRHLRLLTESAANSPPYEIASTRSRCPRRSGTRPKPIKVERKRFPSSGAIRKLFFTEENDNAEKNHVIQLAVQCGGLRRCRARSSGHRARPGR